MKNFQKKFSTTEEESVGVKPLTLEETISDLPLPRIQEAIWQTIKRLEEAAYHYRLSVVEGATYPDSLLTYQELCKRGIVYLGALEQKLDNFSVN